MKIMKNTRHAIPTRFGIIIGRRGALMAAVAHASFDCDSYVTANICVFALFSFATRYAVALIDRASFRPGVLGIRHYSRAVKSTNENERLLFSWGTLRGLATTASRRRRRRRDAVTSPIDVRALALPTLRLLLIWNFKKYAIYSFYDRLSSLWVYLSTLLSLQPL